MKRENRYLVIKLSDLETARSILPKTHLEGFQMVCNTIEKIRRGGTCHNPPFNCVVVESGWPEYEKVWEMMEERVDRELKNS